MLPTDQANNRRTGSRQHRRQQSAVDGVAAHNHLGAARAKALLHRRGASLTTLATLSPAKFSDLMVGMTSVANHTGAANPQDLVQDAHQQQYMSAPSPLQMQYQRMNGNTDHGYLMSPQASSNAQTFSSSYLTAVPETYETDEFATLTDNQMQSQIQNHIQSPMHDQTQDFLQQNQLINQYAQLQNQIQTQAAFDASSLPTPIDMGHFSSGPSTPVAMSAQQQPSTWNSDGDVRNSRMVRRVSPGISQRMKAFENLEALEQPTTPSKQPVRHEKIMAKRRTWPFTPTGSPHRQNLAEEQNGHQNVTQQAQQQPTGMSHRRSSTVPSVSTTAPAIVPAAAEYSSGVLSAEPQTPQATQAFAVSKTATHQASSQPTPPISSPSPADTPTTRRRLNNHKRASSLASTPTSVGQGDGIDIEATKTATGISLEEIAQYIKGPDSQTGKFSCLFPGCGKADFGRKENIKSHVQTHLNDRQYECPVCSKCFVRQHDLKRHAKIHTGTKDYQCPCGNQFARHDALTRHRQRGMCIGAFDGIVRKTVKRGRPKKARPSLEERRIQSSNQRRLNLSVSTMASDDTVTSQTFSEYYSDSSFGMSPGDMPQGLDAQAQEGMSSSSAPMPNHAISNFVFPPASEDCAVNSFITTDSVDMAPSSSQQSHPSIEAIPGLISSVPSTPNEDYSSHEASYNSGPEGLMALNSAGVAPSGNLDYMVSGGFDDTDPSVLFAAHSSGLSGDNTMKPLFEDEEFYSAFTPGFLTTQ